MIAVRGCERDSGGGGRDHGDLSIVRRRDALRARPARAPYAGFARSSWRTSTAASSSTASSTCAAAPTTGCAPTRRCRSATRSARTWPRAAGRGCAATSAAHDVYRRLAMQQRVDARVLRGRAAGALRRDARRFARRALAAPQRLLAPPTNSCSSCSPAFSRPSSNGSPTHETCAGSTTCFEIRPREWVRSAGWPRRSPAGDDARQSICEAACEVMDAPVAFLLEPSGRDFASTAMAGVQVQPVTIQPRGDGPAAARRSPPRRRTSSPTRATTRRWRRRWSRRPRPAPPCSSRSCATARSAAC